MRAAWRCFQSESAISAGRLLAASGISVLPPRLSARRSRHSCSGKMARWLGDGGGGGGGAHWETSCRRHGGQTVWCGLVWRGHHR